MSYSFEILLNAEIEQLQNMIRLTEDERLLTRYRSRLFGLTWAWSMWKGSIERQRAMTHPDNGAIDWDATLTPEEIEHAQKLAKKYGLDEEE